MNECICCRDRLIRHLNHRRAYWFCPTCHQEMPNIDEIKVHPVKKKSIVPAKNYSWQA